MSSTDQLPPWENAPAWATHLLRHEGNHDDDRFAWAEAAGGLFLGAPRVADAGRTLMRCIYGIEPGAWQVLQARPECSHAQEAAASGVTGQDAQRARTTAWLELQQALARVALLERALRPFADIARQRRLSWAAVEYSLRDDDEHQVLCDVQRQRAFNRAAEVLYGATGDGAEPPPAAQPLGWLTLADARRLAAGQGPVRLAPRRVDAGGFIVPLLAHVADAGEEQHPDDAALDRFTGVMRAKLAASRAKGRSGWMDPVQTRSSLLARSLVEHVAKGDPVDVAILAMMLSHRGVPHQVLAQQMVYLRRREREDCAAELLARRFPRPANNVQRRHNELMHAAARRIAARPRGEGRRPQGEIEPGASA